jgi:hypothetical protein
MINLSPYGVEWIIGLGLLLGALLGIKKSQEESTKQKAPVPVKSKRKN